jgi:hypothetical protein
VEWSTTLQRRRSSFSSITAYHWGVTAYVHKSARGDAHAGTNNSVYAYRPPHPSRHNVILMSRDGQGCRFVVLDASPLESKAQHDSVMIVMLREAKNPDQRTSPSCPSCKFVEKSQIVYAFSGLRNGFNPRTKMKFSVPRRDGACPVPTEDL